MNICLFPHNDKMNNQQSGQSHWYSKRAGDSAEDDECGTLLQLPNL
jgi:hypothetical protein